MCLRPRARVAVLRQAGSPNEPTRANRIREDLARCCKLEGYQATIHPDDLRRMVVASGFDAGKSPDELKYAITHSFKTDMLGPYMSKSSYAQLCPAVDSLLTLAATSTQPASSLAAKRSVTSSSRLTKPNSSPTVSGLDSLPGVSPEGL